MNTSNTPWIKKYEPKKPEDVVGQEQGVVAIQDFLRNFKKQRKKALLLHGPSGTGKSCSVYAIADKEGLELIELNASDFRNKGAIESVLGNALGQMSLFHKGKVILVDEIDGVAGREDRGGLSAVTALIEDSAFPIILAANDVWNKKFKTLRKKATLVEFGEVGYQDVFNLFEKIAGEEKVKYDEMALKSLARRCGGDLRAGINDLQSLSQMHGKIDMKAVDSTSQRERTDSIKNALVKVFKSKDPKIARSSFDNVDEDMDQVFLWIDENLPREYLEPSDLEQAYQFMAKADVFRGRIRRWQHWRFLVYIYSFLSSGIAISKKEKYKHMVEYQQTKRLLKLWMANQKNMKRKAISGKMGEKLHTSSKEAFQDIYPFMKHIVVKSKKDKVFLDRFMNYFDLDKEELAHMLK